MDTPSPRSLNQRPPMDMLTPRSPDELQPKMVSSPAPFSGQEILAIWEASSAQHPLDRGLTILAGGFPEVSWQILADMSVGQRDGLLLDLFACTFGERMRAQAVCPSCRHELEFELDAGQLRLKSGADGEDRFRASIEEDLVFEYRLPTSRDLAALVAAQPDDGARFLARRCILQISQSEAALEQQDAKTPFDMPGEYPAGASAQANQGIDLPETLLAAFSAGIAANDPQADINLELTCPECGTSWQLGFDILEFFWTEIQTQAQRQVRQVHLLARSYGWSEKEILQMSPARRRLYLELAGS